MPNKRLNFTALSAWLIGSAFMAVTALLWFGQDFRGYYAAARVVLAGGNPYDYHVLAPVLLEITGKAGNNPYYYVPWFSWFIIPLSWLPFNIARCVWMAFNWALWNLGLWRLGKLLNWPEIGWKRWLFFLFVTLVFAWFTWRYEQTGILLFTLMVETLLALQNKNLTWAGIWLALLLLKPNVTLVPVATISLWLIRRRNWRPVAVMSGLIIGLLVISFVVTPDWFRPFLEPGFGQGLSYELDGPGHIVASRINTTLDNWLISLRVPTDKAGIASILALVVGSILLVIIAWKSDSLVETALVSVLTSFAVTPYALQYDYPLLTFVLWGNMAYINHRKRLGARIIGYLTVLFIAGVLFWERSMSDGYWIVVGLIALTVWNWQDVIKLPTRQIRHCTIPAGQKSISNKDAENRQIS